MTNKTKFTTIIIILAIMLQGCSNDDLLLSYTTNHSTQGITSFVASDSSYRGGYEHDRVCIIPPESVSMPEGTDFTSEGILLVDADGNEMIMSKNIYAKMYPASLTKLATALVCLKYGNFDDTVTVSYAASHISEPEAKLCFLQEGDRINFKTLLISFIVYSGNDAGIALAEHIAGSEAAFVELMNNELTKIGAVDTHFVNSHGLPDDDHYTTVYDMYLVMNELLSYEEFLEFAAMSSYTAEFTDSSGREIKKVYENTNKYLTGERALPDEISIIASKTGTTVAAGSCLALAVTAKSGKKYIAIIMKAWNPVSLYNEMNNLLEYCN